MNKLLALIRQQSSWYLISLFLLAVAALVLSVIPYMVGIDNTWESWLDTVSRVIYVIFFLDFVYFWFQAKNRKTYLKDNWISLLALLLPVKGLKAFKGIKGIKALKGVKILKTLKLGKKIRTKKKERGL